MDLMKSEKNHDLHIPIDQEIYDKLESIKDYYGIKNSTEIIRFLIRIGYDNIWGYLRGGFSNWANSGEKIEKIDTWSVHQLKEGLMDESIFILDVREIGEWEEGHIQGAHHIYVGDLRNRLNEVPQDKYIVVYCDTGNRASIVASAWVCCSFDC